MNLSDKRALLDLLSDNALVITPNNRLSAALLKDYFLSQQKPTLKKPSCLPYTTFLDNAYQALRFQKANRPLPLLINSFLVRSLLKPLIQADPAITFNEGLFKAVSDAIATCHQWQIDVENPAFQYTTQTRQFQTWWRELNQILQSKNLIHEHQIAPHLINESFTPSQQNIVWLCFDDFNPQQKSLQTLWDSQGKTQYYFDLPQKPTQTSFYPAKDNKDEYEQLMLWLQQKVSESHARIGVVIPELQQEASKLERMLKNHIPHELYNISIGHPLSQYPLVAHALTWLKLPTHSLTTHQAALLLHSPYLAHAQKEFSERAQILEQSSMLQNQTISLTHWIKSLKKQAPKLAESLEQIKPYPENASPEEWMVLFQNRLNTMGFPGDYGLNSKNYQIMSRWNGLFDEFRQLSLIHNTLTRTEALEAMQQLAHKTIFQIQKEDSPIHISGLLEASGVQFDVLWIQGLTDQCLPQKVKLSPFIPHPLQRESNMPHSTPQRELKFAQQTLSRLQNGSEQCILSYARMAADIPQLPCTLIVGFPEYIQMSSSETLKPQQALISHEENYLVPIRENEPISGGTALLANQAKCPFKAFAEHRLKVRATPKIVDGLDPKERGQIIHKVMELLWSRIQSQHELLHLSQSQLEEYVSEAINHTLMQLDHKQPDILRELEFSRLKPLVFSFLDWEKQRPPFKISTLEQSFTIELAGIEFKVRVDRLDQVDDSKWLIDYKSSLPTSRPWNEERPKEPQLLLYALLDQTINTLLLVQLKSGKIKCSGISEFSTEIQGISSIKKGESWQDYRGRWQEQLHQLATEFQEGYCLPNPANLSICQICDFQNLCRFQASE